MILSVLLKRWDVTNMTHLLSYYEFIPMAEVIAIDCGSDYKN